MNAFELLEHAGSVDPAGDDVMGRARRPWFGARLLGSHPGISAAAAAAVLATGGVTVWAAVGRPTNPRTNTTIECGYNTYIPVESGDPILDCRNVLRRQDHRVPALAGWITPTGLVAVLSKSDRPPAGSVPLPKGFHEKGFLLYLDDEMSDVAAPIATGCRSAANATGFASKELGVAGLFGWVVKVRQGAGSCSIYVSLTDASSKTLTLIPESYNSSPNVTVSLDKELRSQLGSSPDARCVAPADAAALVKQDARALRIDARSVIVSEAGAIGTGSPKCSIATLDPAGGIEVTIWIVPGASR
ncbi:MAG: hypothetical protein ACLQK4_09025 [Acidimicrobiales bacterium]|jgi:hypothetical protein